MELLLIVAFVVVILYLVNIYFYSFWTKRNVTQLTPKFLFGDALDLLTMKESISKYFDKIYIAHKNNRGIGIYFFFRPVFMPVDPELVQDIMVRDFTSFHDRPLPVDEVNDPLSGHLFSLAGQKWRNLRVKLSPTFTSGKLKGMFPVIRDCGNVLDEYLVRNVKEGNDVMEFRDLLARYSTNIISSVAFGIENDCINDPDHVFRKMGAKVFETGFTNGIRNAMSFLAPNWFYKLGLRTVDAGVEDFIFSIVKQTVDLREKTNFTRNDFMQLLLQLKNKGFVAVDKGEGDEEATHISDKIKITFNELAAQVFVFFIAGFETSSSTMSFCLYELAKNPEIQRKVQDEIDRVMKKAGPDGKITYDLLGEMKYLECCIDEALRKYPIVPILVRQCTKDYQVSKSDIVIPNGTQVMIPVFSLHRDPEIFENPLEFKPERFLINPNGSDKVKGLFYMPFGDGPRNCIGLYLIFFFPFKLPTNFSFYFIGMRMGKLTSKIGLAVMLSKFNFSFQDKTVADNELEFHPSQFVLTPIKPFNLKISSR